MSLQLIKLWLLQSACDISLNVFHIAENRYILQNNIPEFRGNGEPINSFQKRIQSYSKNVRKEGSIQRNIVSHYQLFIWGFLQIAPLYVSDLWTQSNFNGDLILHRSHPLSSKHCFSKNHLPTAWNSRNDSSSILWCFSRSSADSILRRCDRSLPWIRFASLDDGSQVDMPLLSEPNVVKEYIWSMK